MATYDIHCADCGAEYRAKRIDAKYCPACRLLRILTYTAGRLGKKKCRVCQEVYRPSSTKDLRYCAACAPPSNTAKTSECRVCYEVAPQHERVEVCTPCVKGVSSQATVIKALKYGQAQRANRDNARPPA